MSQKYNKDVVTVSDAHKNATHEDGITMERYLPWDEIANIDWDRVEQLCVSGSETDVYRQKGCYVDQGYVVLLGATEALIRECISMCGDELRFLEFSHIALKEIPEEVRDLKDLRYLNLRGMRLEELPDWLPEIAERFTVDALNNECGKQKAVVNFCNTEVNGIDMSIFEQSYETVAAWFEERKREDVVPLNEVKVVFLGDGEAGKTHTITRLLMDGEKLDGMGFDGYVTPGIVIRNKEYELDGKRIQVHFWDFGGQEILHSMHRMFLTERTLYVVLINARDDTQDDRARYWLHNIRSFAGNSPVLLVLNKIDQNPNASVNESDLRTIYPNLTEVVKLSTLVYSKDEFNNSLTEALLKQIREMGILGTLWPKSWLKLKAGLERMETNYIHGVDYEELCDACGVEQNRKELLRWFNDLGVGFSYSGRAGMEDYVIVKPEWIINAIYIILFNKVPDEQNGIIPHASIVRMLHAPRVGRDEVRRVLRDVFYNAQEVEYILGILRKYRLSFKIREDAEFFPALCQRESMAVAMEYGNDPDSLEFRMTFTYLPDNVIHRLMVEMRQDLDTRNVWRFGARFVQQGTGLSAVVKSEGDVLRIFVRTDSSLHLPNTYLHIIKGNVDRIVEDMKLRSPHCEVIYKVDGITEAFDYEGLISALQYGETTYRSRRLRRAISIQDILNQTAWPAEMALNGLREDIITACMHLQNNRMYWSASENELNDFVDNILRAKGYCILEKARGGIAHNGKDTDKPDFEIRQEREIPWTICEALKIRDKSKTVWNVHLKKLLDNYNPSGMNYLFLLTYVDCDKDAFQDIVDDFSEHIRWHNAKGYERLPNSFARIDLRRHNNPNYICAAKCTYDCAGSLTTVCHIFVRIGSGQSGDVGYSVPNQPKIEPPPIKPALVQPAKPILQEYRVVFLGDSEAGKSQIMYRVKNPGKKASGYVSKTTVGIDIFRRVETINKRSVRVNYWDFGGQEILHAMHRIFLAENTLYVIVLNTRNDNQDAQANFWLRYVEAYAPEAPVLLVMNKMDQNERAELNLPVLRRTFQREFTAKDVLKISAVAEPNVFREAFTEQLQACIERHLRETEDYTDQQSRIRDAVEKKKEVEKIISIDDFIEICKKEELCSEKEQTVLMNRFNDNGIVVHFKGKTLMFMNPEWITKTLYRILEEGGKVAENGIIRHSQLQTMCRENPDKWRGSEDADRLVEIMRDYDFSFQYEKADPKEKDTVDKEFIPVLCRREEPDAVEEQITCDNVLEMRIDFSYLPSDVLYQLMVRHKKDLDADMVWASGAKFNFGSASYAFVRRDGNMLDIFTHYPSEGTRERAVKYMYMLKDQVVEIVSERQSTAKILQIKLGYMVGSRMEYFDLQQLENAKTCGVYYTVSPGEEARKIAVRDILDQQDRSIERKTDKLLGDLAVACSQLQQRAPFLDSQEDVRNSYIVDAMKNMKYDITDQSLIGKATSGKRQNELDMLIRFPNREPWMVIEALVVTPQKAITVWNSHLDKLIGRYNASWGLRKLALVSYVDCPEADFEKLYKKYRDHMKIHSPKEAQIQESSFDACPELSQKNYLKVDRCAYIKQGNLVMVYHYFVRMEEKEEVQQQDDIEISESDVLC